MLTLHVMQGPVIAENLGEPESKEALKDRAKALNKEDDA